MLQLRLIVTKMSKERKKNQLSLPTIIHNAHGPNISANEVVNIAPGEGQLPDQEALGFINNFPIGENHFITERKVRITACEYLNARLKCCDGSFASDLQCIF